MASKDTMRMKAILVVTAALAFAVSPLWTSGFNGFEADQFPIPQQDPPVQPAGYAFSIWGVIYLWLIVSVGYGLLKRADAPDWDAPRWPLTASLAVGSTWLAVAVASPVWATVLIWVMLGSALLAMFAAPSREPWLGRYPIELYAGWLTAASCVSIGLLGAGYGIAFGATAWAFIALGIATAIAAAVLLRGPAPAYAVAVVWALVGVIVANLGSAPLVAAAAALAGALVAWLAIRR